MEATDQSQETSIESLPNDLLVLILASSGCKSIIKASAVSKRMQIIFKTFHNISIFSAGSSTSPLLEEAVKESASRAMAGMLGHVSFALIFTCNHERKKGPSPAALLSNHLPRGTPIVGAASRGLMGIDEEGNPFEISPGDNIQHGVSVLLGHLPGAICRVFCDCSKPTNPIQTSLEQWTGLDQKDRGWIPVSCWLLAQGGRRAARVTSALIEWLQRRELRVQGFSYPTIAGGESSGGLDFHPGDQEGQERVTGWFSPQGARYCGLMILKESLTSTAAEMMMTPSPLPPPRSTVLAIHGSGPISTASVWTGFKNLAVERVQNGDVQVAVVTTPHISSIRRLNDNNCEVGSGFLHQVQEETEQFISHGYPKICLWSSDGDSPDLDPRSMIAAVRSGFGAIGDLYDQEDILAIFDGHDENIVQRILERGHERVRCCLVWIHEGGVRGVLGTELVSSVRSVTSPVNELNQELLAIAAGNARSVGGKGGSSTALCLFSCTGRGKSVIGSEESKTRKISEAVIADSCCGGTVPVVGCFLNGEIGPRIVAGYIGWSSYEKGSEHSLPRDFKSVVEMQGFTTMYACLGS